MPFYRGAGPHFWPSYLLEPQMTGVSMHDLTDAIDGGAVVHQSVGVLTRGDGLHELSCRATSGFAAELPEVLVRAFDGRLMPLQPQKTTGRLWRSVDFRPAHLRGLLTAARAVFASRSTGPPRLRSGVRCRRQ